MSAARALYQEAYLVNSLEEAAERWTRAFGAGPFFAVRHHRTEEFSYRGRRLEADVSYAFGYLGELMIQLIEQHDDTPSIYRDMYARGEQGFHHVAYFDTRALNGGFTEIHGDPAHILGIFGTWQRAHQAWDLRGGALREFEQMPVYRRAALLPLKG